MIVAINYADSKFEKQRRYNTKTAYSKGKVDKVIEYSPNDIDESFKEMNNHILSYPRGAGLWLWKPYFILKTLSKLEYGDYLFYCDSGAYYVNDVRFLIQALKRSKQSIMGFEIPTLERQFTKKESFTLMDYSKYDNNQLLGGYVLLKKEDFSIRFVEEWLKYATNEKIISPNYFIPEIEEFEDFRSHREDQSIFSILYHKHNLAPFRDPSQFGDRPWEYIYIPAFSAWSSPWVYNPLQYTNSDYPKIVVSCRTSNPYRYKIKETLKTFLSVIGLYNERIYIKYHNAQKG
ncbi:MAG: hypothetical protein ACK5KT_08040 [Dysgonomonas sp.]